MPAVTAEGIGYDPGRGEVWFAGEAAEAFQLELEAKCRLVESQARELAARVARAEPRVRHADPRLVGLAERLEVQLGLAVDAAKRREQPFEAESRTESGRAGELASELRRLGAAEADLRHEASGAGERAAAVDVELARLDAEATEVRRRLAEAQGAEPAEGPRDELEAKLVKLERRREQLGGVNPFAKEEYEREKEHLEEVRTQRSDLEQSLAELEKLRRELTETVERRFAETFAAVERNFAEVAGTLFPGGEGRLRLTEVEAEGEDGGAEQGIEVELRPAGKKITRLSLLSGGEKAIGAISFLFALFLARPCAFYLLDEVEAALDDTNIGRFVVTPTRVRRPRAVHRRHAPEADDGGRRHPLRRDDGRRRRLAGSLAQAPARGADSSRGVASALGSRCAGVVEQPRVASETDSATAQRAHAGLPGGAFLEDAAVDRRTAGTGAASRHARLPSLLRASHHLRPTASLHSLSSSAARGLAVAQTQ